MNCWWAFFLAIIVNIIHIHLEFKKMDEMEVERFRENWLSRERMGEWETKMSECQTHMQMERETWWLLIIENESGGGSGAHRAKLSSEPRCKLLRNHCSDRARRENYGSSYSNKGGVLKDSSDWVAFHFSFFSKCAREGNGDEKEKKWIQKRRRRRIELIKSGHLEKEWGLESGRERLVFCRESSYVMEWLKWVEWREYLSE